MISKLFLLFCTLYTVSSKYVNSKEQSYPALQWPDEYSVEAKTMYLSSGLVENFKYWRYSQSSSKIFTRLDSNDGAVVKITQQEEDSPFGILYVSHPETTEYKLNKMVCYKTTGSSEEERVNPLDFLPDTYGLEEAGEDNVRGVNCVKFTEDKPEKHKVLKNILWAYYDETNATGAWVPVRYEEQVYNTWHGYISGHKIWDFYNFEPDVYISDFTVESQKKCILVENEEEEDIKLAAEVATEDEHHLNHDFTATEAEMKTYKELRRPSSLTAENIPFPYTQEKPKQLAETLPFEYDARMEGLVGPVLNQEDCDSYSFVATAAMEGALARSNGEKLIRLANQALLDCSWGYGNKGCSDGSNENSFKWIMKHGLPTELDYGTYANTDGYCKLKNMTNTYKLRGFTKVTPLSIDALKIALVNHGPLAVTVDATEDFLSYDQGIFYDWSCSSTDVNTPVLLVGYGVKDGEEFWIIKNSRGPFWGLGGYMHISMRDNNCGVATEAYYAFV